jgi:DNA-binding NarL/FixJ family response regulator
MSGERRKRARILIADSQILARRACQALLKPEFEIVGLASNGSKLVECASKLKPDIVIAETNMPRMSGFEAGDEIKRQNRATKLIYMSSSLDPGVAAQAFEHGASGYLVKTCAENELAHAVRCISRGESYLCSLITQSTLELLILLAEERRKKKASRRHIASLAAAPTELQPVEIRRTALIQEQDSTPRPPN